ncbi:hypothetical protein D9M71_650250 [compost metagenome]
MGDVHQRAPGVDRQHAENLGGPWGEPADTHVAIDKHGSNVGGGNQVGQIVVDLVGFLDLGLEFGIDGQQLFIDRLQFFLAGFQFFGGRTQLFVNRVHFLVGSLELLTGYVRLFDGFLQM